MRSERHGVLPNERGAGRIGRGSITPRSESPDEPVRVPRVRAAARVHGRFGEAVPAVRVGPVETRTDTRTGASTEGESRTRANTGRTRTEAAVHWARDASADTRGVGARRGSRGRAVLAEE